MKKLFLFAFLFSLVNVFAQDTDSYIEVLKSEIKTDKKAIIIETMQFTEQQSAAFWPVYNEFEHELEKLSGKRIANIKDFAANYDSLTDKKADELIKTSFSFQNDRLDLNEKYYKKFADVLTPIVAAKYMQLENQIQLILDLSIAANLPLAKKPGTKQ
jgi:flagellar biosynthesis chaperone FliJ